MLHLITLGALSVESDLGPVAGAALRRRPLALLALASPSPYGLTRDKALAYLWPESDTAHARNCLKQTLFALRRDVGEELFLPGGCSLRIDPGMVEVDRWGFGRALERGTLREAVDVYTGAFLDGFHVGGLVEFERWVETERARLANRYQVTLEALKGEAERAGDMMGALRWWRRLAEHDPLSSRIALGLIRALVAVGDRAEAFRTAESHRRQLEEVFGELPDTDEFLIVEQLRRNLARTGAVRGAHPPT
jgi:DNA-binding SARP family transcriptional activator